MFVDLYRLQLRDEEGMKANLVVLAYECTDEDEDNTGIEWQAILMARTISLPTIKSLLTGCTEQVQVSREKSATLIN